MVATPQISAGTAAVKGAVLRTTARDNKTIKELFSEKMDAFTDTLRSISGGGGSSRDKVGSSSQLYRPSESRPDAVCRVMGTPGSVWTADDIRSWLVRSGVDAGYAGIISAALGSGDVVAFFAPSVLDQTRDPAATYEILTKFLGEQAALIPRQGILAFWNALRIAPLE